MIDLEKRAKAWDEFSGEAREFTIGDTFNSAYELGVRDGAASVDRKAIVDKAFNKLWSKLKIGAGSINGAETTKKAIDAILADMGGDDEQV